VRDCGLAALEAAPSHLIVYAGHNDFNNWGFEEPGRLIALEENSWVYALDHLLARGRVYSLLIRRIRPLEQKSIRERIILPEPERSARARAIILAKTEENLIRLVEAAADRGTIVVLLTVVSNLDEFPHTRDEWDVEPAKLVERRPEFVIWREAFEEGIAADRRGEHEAALVAFKRARDIYQQGRAHSELNDLLRALAARYQNTRLVDFEATLDRISRGEGIGCNYFGDERYCDQFHPNARSQMRIAEALLPALLEGDR
jgi:lysophospholipase L1-like esterase